MRRKKKKVDLMLIELPKNVVLYIFWQFHVLTDKNHRNRINVYTTNIVAMMVSINTTY